MNAALKSDTIPDNHNPPNSVKRRFGFSVLTKPMPDITNSVVVPSGENMLPEQESLSDEKTLSDLADYCSKHFDTLAQRRNASVEGSRIRNQELKELVNWLKAWRTKSKNSEEHFKMSLLLLLAHRIEDDVEQRLETVFSERFRSIVSSAGK